VNVPHVHSDQSVLQNLIRHSFTPALFVDRSFSIVQANHLIAELLSVDLDAILGRSLFDFVPADLVASIAAELRALADAGMRHDHKSVVIPLGPAGPNATVSLIEAEFGGVLGFLVQANGMARHATDLNWEAALEGAGQGVWDYNIQTGVKLHSKAWHDMRGVSPDAAPNPDQDEWLTKIHPDDLLVTQRFTQELEAGELSDVQYEYRERHAKGHWIWIMCRGRPIAWGPDGKPTRYVGTDTDITAIKAAQAKVNLLSNHEVRWKNAQESTEQGLWDINTATGEKYLSPRWFRIRGLPEEESSLAGYDQWMSRVHPDDLSRIRSEIVIQEQSNSDQTQLEYRERHQNGQWIWILSRGRVVKRDANGRATRTVGTDTDITEMKTSRERFERISRRLEMALTASKVGVWEFDLTTNRVDWDPIMREMYGLPGDLAPLPRNIWEDALHPDDKADAIALTTLAMANKQDYILDYRVIRQDGVVRNLRSRASHIDDFHDGPKLIGLNWDVTQDYELAQELKNANAVALKRNNELEAARALMEHNSLHDALTGLPNRRMLDTVQRASVENADAGNRRFAVLHVDLDRFKQINDTLGHAAGDAVLIRTAAILRETVGPHDLVARVGGDEFAVFIENAPPEEELVNLARQIITKSSMPIKYLHHECRCGVSVGIAYAEGQGIDSKSLFINADLAMYRSKHSGRGGYSVFNDDMRREALEKKNRSDQLLTAIERDEFFCLYQPQYASKSLRLTGVETLVRWNNPRQGLMSPTDFLPLADELQIIDRIDEIVLRLALRDLAAWQVAGLVIPRLSINISGRRLRDPNLAAELMRLEMPKGILSFEFLESIFLDEPDEVQMMNINCIRALGIGVEVDDFGSGHSSIVSLLKLKPDRLKIDRTIIEPVTRSKRQRQLVQSIVDIGNLQGITVLAEGVETMAHVEILQAIGCDEFQGYALARPMSADDLGKLLAAQFRAPF
jgi:diguanylate cyclase (GGDEF)-like protein/PAS domain S-box-containing protein